MFDEKALRRPDFLEACSVPVTLADGQEWQVPKPMILFLPTGDELGYEVEIETGDKEFDTTFGQAWRNYRLTIDDPMAAQEKGLNYPKASFAVFAAMLLRNYSLDLHHLRALLKMKFGVPDAVRESLMAVAQGMDAPKAWSDGADLL